MESNLGESGVLIEVRWEWDGTETIEAVSSGETEIPILNATTLADDEVVWIGGTGPYQIVSVDVDSDVLEITPPLTDDVLENDPVVPDIGGGPAQVWVAEVVLLDSNTSIEVPLTIHDLSVMPEGIYDPPKAVLVSDDHQQIIDLPGSLPQVSGTYIPPGTLPDQPTEPPSVSPELTAVGALDTIILVAKGDVAPSTVLDYYMDGVLIETTRSTVVLVSSDPLDNPLEFDRVYEFYVVARNDIGSGPPSNTVEGSLDPGVSAEVVLGIVSAGFILAGAIQVGNIAIDPDDGIVIPLSTGGEIRFPADGSPAIIEAILRTRDLTVDGGLALNGSANYINGTLNLSAGVADPTQAPGMNESDWASWEIEFPGTANTARSARGYGVLSDTGRHAFILVLPTESEKQLMIFNAAGDTLIASVHSDDALLNMTSVTCSANRVFVLGERWNSSASKSQWRVHSYGAGGAPGASAWLLDHNGNRISRQIGYLDGAIALDPNGTTFWVVRTGSGGGLRFWEYNIADLSTGPQVSPVSTFTAGNNPNVTFLSGAMYVGSDGGFSGKRFILGAIAGDKWRMHAWDASGAYQAADTFGVTAEQGVVWDGIQFRGLTVRDDGVKVFRYSIVAAPYTSGFCYTWYDTNTVGGNKESAPSPVATRLISARCWPVAQVPPPPNSGVGDDTPNAVRIYYGLVAATSTLIATITTGNAATYIQDDLFPSGPNPPAVSTFPASANIGEVAAASGGFSIDGNSNGSVGTGTFRDSIRASSLPPGSMLDYAGSTAPAGYLVCDGSEVSRTDYAALFAVIGTLWGSGDGSTTFNLPDSRRRFVAGAGGSLALGASDEQSTVNDRNPIHSHGSGTLETGATGNPGLTYNTPNTGSQIVPRNGGYLSHTHPVSGSTGSTNGWGTAGGSVFPFIAATKIIKT